MILVTNGCSMTKGAELKLETRDWTRYSYLLSQKLGFFQEENLAVAGSSNQRILRTTIDWIRETNIPKEEIFFVIQWSSVTRNEYYNEHLKCFRQILINFEHNFDVPYSEYYFKYFQNIIHDDINYSNFIYCLENIFENNNIKYFMFSGLKDEPFGKKLNMHGVLGEMGFSKGAGGHPLEEGHAYWAEHLYQHIVKNKIL